MAREYKTYNKKDETEKIIKDLKSGVPPGGRSNVNFDIWTFQNKANRDMVAKTARGMVNKDTRKRAYNVEPSTHTNQVYPPFTIVDHQGKATSSFAEGHKYGARKYKKVYSVEISRKRR